MICERCEWAYDPIAHRWLCPRCKHKADCCFEASTTNRDDDFKARFRFPFDQALTLARRIAPTLECNGHPVEHALAQPDWS